MLLLAFLVVPLALASTKNLETKSLKNYDYVVDIVDHTLIMVRETRRPSLQLSNLELGAIDKNAFDNITAESVTSLDLSNNSLSVLPELVFSKLTNLEYLSLANNQLSSLRNAFLGLGNLRSLDISNNMMRSLRRGYFSGLNENCTIIVKGNPISGLYRDAFENEAGGYVKNLAKICIDKGIVESLDYTNEATISETEDCSQVKINDGILKLRDLGISTFRKGWYRIKDIRVREIDLTGNKIVRITSEFFNDLPNDIQGLYLRGNKIDYLEKGIIMNNHLRTLDLSENVIYEIEDSAFENTAVLDLNLNGNRLSNTKFVKTLPLSIGTLNLNDNNITEIAEHSFDKLRYLRELKIANNRIKELKKDSFAGLTILEKLNLTNNGLERIESGAFGDLMLLDYLDLSKNKISSLEMGAFAGLTKIKELQLNDNKIKEVTREWLSDLPNTLLTLGLNDNEIENLRAGTFVTVPRLFLLLNNNNISTIEKGSFDLPNVVQILMDNNRLTEINGESWQGLPNLRSLLVAANHIDSIQKNAFQYLDRLEFLDLADNPIRKLENGALYKLLWIKAYRPNAITVDFANIPFESILAGVFNEE